MLKTTRWVFFRFEWRSTHASPRFFMFSVESRFETLDGVSTLCNGQLDFWIIFKSKSVIVMFMSHVIGGVFDKALMLFFKAIRPNEPKSLYIVLDIEFQWDILLMHFISFQNLRVEETKKFSINWNFEMKTIWDTRNYTCVKIDCLKQTYSQRLG